MSDVSDLLQSELASRGAISTAPADDGRAALEQAVLRKATTRSFDTDQTGNIIGLTGSPAAHAAFDPTASMSPTEQEFAGMGRWINQLGIGNRQAGNQILNAGMPGKFNQELQSANQDAANARETDRPLMNTAGGKVGNLMGGLSLAAVPGANTYTGAALLGAATGATLPTVGNESRLANTAFGGTLGVGGKAIGDSLGRWLSPKALGAAEELTVAQQQALADGQQLGMRVTPGQQTGSKALQQLEAKMSSQPWTSGPFNQIEAGNRSALKSTVANAIGESGSTVDSTVLRNASDRLGQVFELVRSPNNVVAIDPAKTRAVLDSIDKDFEGLLPGDASILDNKFVRTLNGLIENGGESRGYLSNLTTGANAPTVVTGEQLGQLSSKLGKSAFKEMTTPAGDRDLGQALYAVKNHVDDLLQGSLSGTEAATYAAARQQYRNLMNVTSRAGIVNPSTGNVSGTALANKLQQADKSGYLYGRNQTPMYQAARFAQAFKPTIGDSGTATRLPNLMNPAEWVLGIPSNLAARAYLSRPGSAMVRGAIGGSRALPALGPAIGRRFPQVPGLLQSAPTGGLLLPYLSQ